jgi:hypothetical protein
LILASLVEKQVVAEGLVIDPIRLDAGDTVLAVLAFSASGLFAYLLYRLSLRDPRPTYTITGNVLVRSAPRRGIEVRMEGQDVPRVTRSILLIWNSGRGTIRQADVPEGAPLTIIVQGADRVLNAAVVAVTRPEIGFRLESVNRGELELTFHHLDHRDGATVEILHTGSDPYGLTLAGTVAGTKGRFEEIRSPLWDDPGGYKGTLWLGGVGVLAILIAGIYVDPLYLVGAPIAIALTAWSAWKSYRKDRRSLPSALWKQLPEGLPFRSFRS